MLLKNNKLVEKSSHGTLKVPWLTLCLAVMFICIYALGENIFNLLVFDRAAIANGDFWRFFTGHMVHYNFDHLLWDLIAFVILGSVIELNHPQQLMLSLLISSIGVSFWLYYFEPIILTYCGLSGALNGLLVIASMMLWNKTESCIYLFVMLSTIGKICYEFTTNQTVFVSMSAHPMPSSHLVGFISGLICFFLLRKKVNMIE
ncbi:MAG: rhombosortase [Candidatus Omnitrophica bacterium]|nr:rhombosortase [Candidatus Omnitrophota bacterium]MBU1997033.1 rhombosortase [Candidatus Omnitrophota bacterium]MBU4333172.1 rhombosortase [Candidatus Omnitrophota bacterium]